MKVTSFPDSHLQIKVFVALEDFYKIFNNVSFGEMLTAWSIYFVHGVNCTHISWFSGLELMKDLFLFS